MNEQTKAIIDRARALLAAAAAGEGDVEVTCVGHNSERVEELYEASPDLLATLCDALEAAERRAEEAEAQAGAVRNAMDERGGIHTYYVGDHGWGGYEKCPVCEAVADALATGAGRGLLDRLQAAEAKVARLETRKAELCGCVRFGDPEAEYIDQKCEGCHGFGAVIVEDGK